MIEETVIVPHQEAIFPHVEFQKRKFWHFQFKDPSNNNELKKRLEAHSLTASFQFNGKKHPDVTLYNGMTQIGKIQFLHSNRKDVKNPSKRYIHIMFYVESSFFKIVKETVLSFFESLTTSPLGIPVLKVNEKKEPTDFELELDLSPEIENDTKVMLTDSKPLMDSKPLIDSKPSIMLPARKSLQPRTSSFLHWKETKRLHKRNQSHKRNKLHKRKTNRIQSRQKNKTRSR